MATKIYTLNTCNAWKEWSSMSLYFIGTSQDKLIAAIRKGIRQGDFFYGSKEDSRNKQLERLKEDLNEFRWLHLIHPSYSVIHEVSSRLKEAYIDINENNSYAV